MIQSLLEIKCFFSSQLFWNIHCNSFNFCSLTHIVMIMQLKKFPPAKSQQQGVCTFLCTCLNLINFNPLVLWTNLLHFLIFTQVESIHIFITVQLMFNNFFVRLAIVFVGQKFKVIKCRCYSNATEIPTWRNLRFSS